MTLFTHATPTLSPHLDAALHPTLHAVACALFPDGVPFDEELLRREVTTRDAYLRYLVSAHSRTDTPAVDYDQFVQQYGQAPDATTAFDLSAGRWDGSHDGWWMVEPAQGFGPFPIPATLDASVYQSIMAHFQGLRPAAGWEGTIPTRRGRPARLLPFGGEMLPISEIAARLGVTPAAIHNRLAAGLPLEKVLAPRQRKTSDQVRQEAANKYLERVAQQAASMPEPQWVQALKARPVDSLTEDELRALKQYESGETSPQAGGGSGSGSRWRVPVDHRELPPTFQSRDMDERIAQRLPVTPDMTEAEKRAWFESVEPVLVISLETDQYYHIDPDLRQFFVMHTQLGRVAPWLVMPNAKELLRPLPPFGEETVYSKMIRADRDEHQELVDYHVRHWSHLYEEVPAEVTNTGWHRGMARTARTDKVEGVFVHLVERVMAGESAQDVVNDMMGNASYKPWMTRVVQLFNRMVAEPRPNRQREVMQLGSGITYRYEDGKIVKDIPATLYPVNPDVPCSIMGVK